MRPNITTLLVAVSLIALPTLTFSQHVVGSSFALNSFSGASDSALIPIPLDSFQIVNQIKYATNDNFLKQQIYPCAKCYLRKEAAEALLSINEVALAKGYRLVIFDCYRPYSDQIKMFNLLPDERYVADPKKGRLITTRESQLIFPWPLSRVFSFQWAAHLTNFLKNHTLIIQV